MFTIIFSNYSRSDIHLISSLEMEDGEYLGNIDPEDLVIHPDLDKVLEAHRWKWVDDALGIVPHCLQILKGCHLMSERLVTTAMASTDQQKFVELAMVSNMFKVHRKFSFCVFLKCIFINSTLFIHLGRQDSASIS